MGQNSYINFMCLNPSLLNPNGSLLPANTTDILEWVAELGSQGKMPRTIKQYISHIQSLHIDNSLPFEACEATILQRLIQGIKRYHGEKDWNLKLPITIDILHKLANTINPTANITEANFNAAAKVAFADFFVVGNLPSILTKNSVPQFTSLATACSSTPPLMPLPTSSFSSPPLKLTLSKKASQYILHPKLTAQLALTLPSTQATVFAMEQQQQLQQLVTQNMKFSNVDAGAVTLISFTSMYLMTTSANSQIASIGFIPQLSLLNLRLFPSHLPWLEYFPLDLQESGDDQIKLSLFAASCNK
ncbi:hypothetical protein M422DRAFT_246236 [Sphaerobolus stellatus SS14]|nr:hypothetical protein M422DRAFT_246236 [Sphaerobolus stellatus SS14]